MTGLGIAACFALATALVGCGDSDSGSSGSAGAGAGAGAEADGSPASENRGLDGTLQKAQDEAQRLAEEGRKKAEQAVDQAKTEAETMQQQLVTEAESLYERAKGLLNQGNIQQAKDALSKLQDMKAKLPESWQTKIEELAARLEKLSGNLSLPGS